MSDSLNVADTWGMKVRRQADCELWSLNRNGFSNERHWLSIRSLSYETVGTVNSYQMQENSSQAYLQAQRVAAQDMGSAPCILVTPAFRFHHRGAELKLCIGEMVAYEPAERLLRRLSHVLGCEQHACTETGGVDLIRLTVFVGVSCDLDVGLGSDPQTKCILHTA